MRLAPQRDAGHLERVESGVRFFGACRLVRRVHDRHVSLLVCSVAIAAPFARINTMVRQVPQTMPISTLMKSYIAAGIASSLLIGLTPATAAPGEMPRSAPDFGPNVTIFHPNTPVVTINATLQRLSQEPEFSEKRNAVFFMPGTYGSAAGQDDPATATGIVNSEVGYYTAIYGLGQSPEEVRINGALHVEPRQFNPAGNP